jgi:hypothetical protein
MNFKTLLSKSKIAYANKPNQVENVGLIHVFQAGAKWMAEKMNDLEHQKKVFIDAGTSFNVYGYFKYGVCIIAFLVSFFFFLNKNVLFTPISVLIFYFFEVHFLFLFPLLIDKVPNPIQKSIQITHQIGVFCAMIIVIRIAFFMLYGILNLKNPFKNWHIGCLCIIIWYQDEVRNRL